MDEVIIFSFSFLNFQSLTNFELFSDRYWTKGGALRNVPIGGGCRKSKKTKPSSSNYSGDSKDSGGSGLKFFHGLSPAMDFQLGGGGLSLPSSGLSYNQFPLASSTPCFATDTLGNSSSTLMGLSFPLLKQVEGGHGFGQEIGGQGSNIASSIESLSSINQDLHWKLQQQRLAMLFGGEGESGQKQNSGISLQKPQPIMFQNLEISKPDACDQVGVSTGNGSRKEGAIGNLATEWFFDSSSYAPHVNNPTNTSNGNESTTNNWSGMQNWNDLNQYSGLP